MNRIVIAGRTRMQHGHLCIGGHDLDRNFRGVRLLDRFGGHWSSDCPFQVGDVWSVRYIQKVSARKPHVEDVFVMDQRPLRPVPDLKELVLSRSTPWQGDPATLYGGTVRHTRSGSLYVPERGPLPPAAPGTGSPTTRSCPSPPGIELASDTETAPLPGALNGSAHKNLRPSSTLNPWYESRSLASSATTTCPPATTSRSQGSCSRKDR